MEKEIIWTSTALNQLENIYFYLLEETLSFDIADNLIDEFTNSVQILKSNWDIFKTDDLRIPINSDYRTYIKFNYRISYKVTTETIFIIRVRHNSRKLKFYK